MRRHVLLAALAAALVGCGGDVEARNAYVQAVDDARQAFDRDVDAVTGRLGATSTPARARAALGDLGEAAETFTGRLRAVRPPEAVAGLHRELVAAAADFGARLDAARERLGSGRPADYLQTRTDLQRDTAAGAQRMNRLIVRINAGLRRA